MYTLCYIEQLSDTQKGQHLNNEQADEFILYLKNNTMFFILLSYCVSIAARYARYHNQRYPIAFNCP